MKYLSIIILFSLTAKLHSQTDSSHLMVSDSKCSPGEIIVDESGKQTINGIFITGRVYKNNLGKELIEGATVWVKGTKIATTTNKKGLYGLNLTNIKDTSTAFSIIAFIPGQPVKEIVFKEKLKTQQTLDIAVDFQTVPLVDMDYNVFRCFGNVWITGKIYDSSSKEPLGFASVGIRGTNFFCIADSTGKYALNIITLPDTAKTFDLVGTYVSYKPKVVTIKEKISGDLNIDLPLLPSDGIVCFPDLPPLTKKQIRKLKKEQNRTKENE